LDLITGTAIDPNNGTGIDNVELTIINTQTSKYWDGIDWKSEETWLTATGTDDWSYNSSLVTWESGTEYEIKPRATDIATNLELLGPGSSFIFDPDVVIFSDPYPPADEIASSELVEVGITITDAISLVNALTIEYSISTDGGTSWDSWIPVEGYENKSEIKIRENITFVNGTENRIEWRASDRASDSTNNGPAESDEYPILIDNSPQFYFPRVLMLSPVNGTVVTTTTLEFEWTLLNPKYENVTYDLVVGSKNPAWEITISNITELNVTVEDLQDKTIYYWTVIPRFNANQGVAVSDLWNFIVNTEYILPEVVLEYPQNNAVVASKRPTLSWLLDYTGTGLITFDIYYGTSEDPELQIEDYTGTNFTFDTDLEDISTYYWKIVPNLADSPGIASEIWSFTIDIMEIPEIDFSLSLDKEFIELKPGESTTITVTVTNLGEIEDSIKLDLNYSSEAGIFCTLQTPGTQSVTPDNNIIFKFDVEALESAEPGNVQIIVEAASEKATEFGLVVKKDSPLNVKLVKAVTIPKEESAETGQDWFLIGIIIIVIILIMIIIIFFLVRKRKLSKKSEDEEQSELERSDLAKETGEQVMITGPQSDAIPFAQVPQFGQLQPLPQQQQFLPPPFPFMVPQQTMAQPQQLLIQQPSRPLLHEPLPSTLETQDQEKEQLDESTMEQSTAQDQSPEQSQPPTKAQPMQKTCATCGQPMVQIPPGNLLYCAQCQKYE
jgi:hypothetical protein